MAVGSENPWWLDVLQHGAESRYAGYFDIDWESENPALRRKVLLPVLGRPYVEALARGEITLAVNAAAGRFEAHYFDQVFPICPNDWSGIENLTLCTFDPANADGQRHLHDLLERQHFRLAWWRVANDEINWRRFFDVNDLIALRTDDEAVLDATHALPLRLLAEGLIDGLRVDHVDGLADPGAYCRRLRARMEELWSASHGVGHPYLVVEKILGAGETLAASWACDGTTGYDFMDQVSRVLHDRRGEQPLGELWEMISGRPGDFMREEELARRDILDRAFAAQLTSVVAALHRLFRAQPETREFGRPAIRRVVIEILVHLRVYRTYAQVGADPGYSAGERELMRAAHAALRTCLPADRIYVDGIARFLAGRPIGPASGEAQQSAIRRFEQLTAPLAAKGVEDTAFYRYGVLLSRLDVGFDPRRFADGADAFHRASLERLRQFPQSMLATATHDHKRGEDVRARLAVLSSMADEWSAKVRGWLAEAAALFAAIDGTAAPSRGDAAILLQMMVGAWPPALALDDADGRAAFRDRLASWQRKAMREAKLATDWTVPNEPYEAAAREFLLGVFEAAGLIGDIVRFADRIMPAGAVNGLAQTLLKLTSPGVPDIYQGTEFWDFSLVDPDNRRPVDFAARLDAISQQAPVAELASRWRDGRVKQALIRQALAVRHASPRLFDEGDYVPIAATGSAAAHVLAFARRWNGEVAITVVSRLPAALLTEGESIVIPADAWGDTAIALPPELSTLSFCDAISGFSVATSKSMLIRGILRSLPVALLKLETPARQ
jgi:malto-oligosyltrehalose synthase